MDVTAAARIIREGGIVAFPTETVYGLGANALDENAVAKIFRAKGRPADNPIIVHIADTRMLHLVVRSIPPAARKLMRRFWPGPLTIVFPASDAVPGNVTAGLDTVAVRMPDHHLALALIKAAGVPIAAPSANTSGRPSPTMAAHVRDDLPRVPILEGEVSKHGVESTVVSVENRPRVLRHGAISLEQLQKVVPEFRIGTPDAMHPETPGAKYRHYSPERPLTIFGPRQLKELRAYVKGKDAIILCKTQYAALFNNHTVIPLGKTNAEVAHTLFHALRTKQIGKELVVLGVTKTGLGRTIMDRLEKAEKK